MAIDGIGAKVMLNKATEVAKDANAQQRRNEVMLNSAQRQVENAANRLSAQVSDIYKPEEAAIHREREEKKKKKRDDSPAGFMEEEKFNQTNAAKGQCLPEVGMTHTKIDIRV